MKKIRHNMKSIIKTDRSGDSEKVWRVELLLWVAAHNLEELRTV